MTTAEPAIGPTRPPEPSGANVRDPQWIAARLRYELERSIDYAVTKYPDDYDRRQAAESVWLRPGVESLLTTLDAYGVG